MDLERLTKLGFCLIVGQVDRNGKNYGTFNQHGAALTPEGMDLVAQLEAGDDPAAPAEPAPLPQPKRGPGRPRKTDAVAPDPAPEQGLLQLDD